MVVMSSLLMSMLSNNYRVLRLKAEMAEPESFVTVIASSHIFFAIVVTLLSLSVYHIAGATTLFDAIQF